MLTFWSHVHSQQVKMARWRFNTKPKKQDGFEISRKISIVFVLNYASLSTIIKGHAWWKVASTAQNWAIPSLNKSNVPHHSGWTNKLVSCRQRQAMTAQQERLKRGRRENACDSPLRHSREAPSFQPERNKRSTWDWRFFSCSVSRCREPLPSVWPATTCCPEKAAQVSHALLTAPACRCLEGENTIKVGF